MSLRWDQTEKAECLICVCDVHQTSIHRTKIRRGRGGVLQRAGCVLQRAGKGEHRVLQCWIKGATRHGNGQVLEKPHAHFHTCIISGHTCKQELE